MKKYMIVVMLLTFSFYFMVAFPPPIHAADVTLTIGNGSGFPGSHNNVVEVSLDNPSDIVPALRVDITDEGDYLTCTECTPNPDRASQSNCEAVEQFDGDCRVLLISFNPAGNIQIGNGPVLSIDYSIKENAPTEECKNLTFGEIEVADENNQPLDVASVPGEFCFLNCQANADCNDGLFCNGEETCDSESGACQPGGGNPCSSPYLCSENTDQCVIPAVTLDIEDGSGFRGTTNNPVTVNLSTNVDIAGVQLDICNVDDSLTPSGCETTERTKDFNHCGFLQDLPNGCDRVILFSFEQDIYIQEGDGPIAILKYDVSRGPPFETCQNLTPESVLIVSCVDPDGAGGCSAGPPLLNVTLEDGEFCIATPIPTLSEWGLIIFLTIIMGIGVVTLVRRRMV